MLPSAGRAAPAGHRRSPGRREALLASRTGAGAWRLTAAPTRRRPRGPATRPGGFLAATGLCRRDSGCTAFGRDVERSARGQLAAGAACRVSGPREGPRVVGHPTVRVRGRRERSRLRPIIRHRTRNLDSLPTGAPRPGGAAPLGAPDQRRKGVIHVRSSSRDRPRCRSSRLPARCAARAPSLLHQHLANGGEPDVEQLIKRAKDVWHWPRSTTERALDQLAAEGKIALQTGHPGAITVEAAGRPEAGS